MKLYSTIGVLLVVFAAVAIGFGVKAKSVSFEENFFANGVQSEDMSGNYGLDKAHSAIGFKVKHMGLVDVHGYFREFKGTISYDVKDVSKSTVEFSAETKSVDTGVDARDNHLRTADFFDVEKFPTMTFKSTKVEQKNKQWWLTGDLTMKGVTKSVTFPFNLVGFAKDQRGGVKMGVTAETVINRRDFGVNYGGNLPSGVAMLSDNITVVLQLECNQVK
jgi:polyisoprenoid-binding protein YceI